MMADKVGSSEDVNTSSVTEETFTSHQDHKEPLSFVLPLPHLQTSSPSPVSPPSDQTYQLAAAVFQQLRTEKPVAQQLLHYGRKTDAPLPESGDKTTQRQAYQLAFNTLKYQDLLEDIITDSCFHTSQHIPSDLLPLAMVMLFDFQDRRFLFSERSTKKGEERVQDIRDLENSLQSVCKTKLAASLARCRVKQSLQSVSCFLSDSVRTKQHRAKRLPLYAWVNTLKTSVEEVCEALQRAGLCEVKIITDIRERTFCRDPLCPDTLIFSQQLHALLQHSSLTATHALNTQDRSVCLAVSTLRPLLFDNGDVLAVGSFSAMTVAHIAVAAVARCVRVLVCAADHAASHIDEIKELLSQMDIKNVRVLSEAFCGLNEWHATVQRLKVIIVVPQCSSSALNDPVPTMHSEHGDWGLLPDLCHSSVSHSKIHTMTIQQARLLTHALSFPKVQTVVYCTRSVYPEENEQLVKRVLEKTHTHPKLLPFRVNGPIFPDDCPSGNNMDSKFFRLQTSQFTNGCFIARLSRQADPTKVETVHDVLARAAAKGLLGGIIPEQSKTSKKGKSRKNRSTSASSKPSSPSSQETQTGTEHENREDSVTPSEESKGECGEEEKEEDKGEKGGKKGKGLKGSKRKNKRGPKQAKKITTVSKHHPKSPKKRSTRRKINQSHHRRRRRRIPRLTLTLMSSAKPSHHLSPITALAHKLSKNATIKSQQSTSSLIPPAPPPAASTQVQRLTESERAEKTLKEKPESPKQARGKLVRPKKEETTERVLKPADLVLPPISSSSSSSVSRKSSSRTSHSQLTQISASSSSSSVSLPGL